MFKPLNHVHSVLKIRFQRISKQPSQDLQACFMDPSVASDINALPDCTNIARNC